MRIRFWGVRGSLPSPELPIQIKDKIAAIIERLTPEDIKNKNSRERFLNDLPPWLCGTVGGNSPCVSLEFDKDKNNNTEILIFDCGSGIRELGIKLEEEQDKNYRPHIFFSHFHWDHIMGLPFFNAAYNPKMSINFYSPKDNLESILQNQMQHPYFPINMDAMAASKKFNILKGQVKLNACKVSYRKMQHPGDSYAYKVDDGKSTFIYSTDSELSANDFIKNEENSSFFSGADLLVMDSQYTLGEAIEKYNWGHSAFSMAVDFAANWDIKHMVLFHHDPGHNDQKLYNNLQSAKWYTEKMNLKGLKLSLATEGMEIIS